MDSMDSKQCGRRHACSLTEDQGDEIREDLGEVAEDLEVWVTRLQLVPGDLLLASGSGVGTPAHGREVDLDKPSPGRHEGFLGLLRLFRKVVLLHMRHAADDEVRRNSASELEEEDPLLPRFLHVELREAVHVGVRGLDHGGVDGLLLLVLRKELVVPVVAVVAEDVPHCAVFPARDEDLHAVDHRLVGPTVVEVRRGIERDHPSADRLFEVPVPEMALALRFGFAPEALHRAEHDAGRLVLRHGRRSDPPVASPSEFLLLCGSELRIPREIGVVRVRDGSVPALLVVRARTRDRCDLARADQSRERDPAFER